MSARFKWLSTIGMKLFTTVYRRTAIVTRSTDEAIPEISISLPIEMQILNSDDLSTYLKLRPYQDPKEFINRLKAGRICLALFNKEQILQVAWVGTDRIYIPYLERDLILQPEEFYCYDTYTDPKYRSYGLATISAALMLKYFKEKGFRRVVAILALENSAAFGGPIKALNYQFIGQYNFIRFGFWNRYWQEQYGNIPLPKLVKPAK